MNKRDRQILLALVLAGCTANAEPDLNTLMMESTFQIVGPSSERPNATTIGTVFLISKPSIKHPGINLNMLLTANHVFAGITGEAATVYLRTKDPTGAWHKTPYAIHLRSGTNNLWNADTNMDIAAIFLALPQQSLPTIWPNTTLLATEQLLRRYEIHPGDQLSCLGYPLGLEANSAGFPILRTGTIASYPLTPVKDHPTFMFNFDVFGGNSGGPVYLESTGRRYGGAIHADETLRMIMGIVVSEVNHVETTQTLRQSTVTTTSFGISTVVQAQFIQKLIDSMPEPPL